MVEQAKTAGHPAASEKSTHSSGEPAGRFMRLDPFAINSRIAFQRDGTSYAIDRSGVSVKQILPKSGLKLAMAVPARAFKGVAARVRCDGEGNETVTLELHHHDPALSVPLLVADNLDDIAADWHAWSRLMRLPMLIVDASELAQPVREALGMVMVEDPINRRKRITRRPHRPFFLSRRKPGAVGAVERLSAAEIIARS